MDNQPYQSHGNGEAVSPRPCRVWLGLTWFALGFAVSWAAWSVINYMQSQPRDYTRSLPQPIRSLAPEWLKDAEGRAVGNTVLVAPADASDASALVYPLRPSSFPAVIVTDDDADGQIDSIAVADADSRTVTMQLADGRIASTTYSTSIAIDSVSFQDANLDGQYDYRFGPDHAFAIRVNGEWHQVSAEENMRFIEENGVRYPLDFVDGVWRLKDAGE